VVDLDVPRFRRETELAIRIALLLDWRVTVGETIRRA
jgi:hypothetical protein